MSYLDFRQDTFLALLYALFWSHLCFITTINVIQKVFWFPVYHYKWHVNCLWTDIDTTTTWLKPNVILIYPPLITPINITFCFFSKVSYCFWNQQSPRMATLLVLLFITLLAVSPSLTELLKCPTWMATRGRPCGVQREAHLDLTVKILNCGFGCVLVFSCSVAGSSGLFLGSVMLKMGLPHFMKSSWHDVHVSRLFVQASPMTPVEGNPFGSLMTYLHCPEGIFIPWWK